MTHSTNTEVWGFFAGKSELAALMRAFDWAGTPLGPVASWPQRLLTVVDLCLSSAFPMIVLRGEELIQLYNDGYGGILGARHPAALGVSTREVWPEVWHINEPLYTGVQRDKTYFFSRTGCTRSPATVSTRRPTSPSATAQCTTRPATWAACW